MSGEAGYEGVGEAEQVDEMEEKGMALLSEARGGNGREKDGPREVLLMLSGG